MTAAAPVLTVVGSVNEDITVFTSALPGPGETVLADRSRRSPGGKGANQAAAAARLGGGARLIGAVGADAAGDRMIAALRSAGVDVGGVDRAAEATGEAHIVVDTAGENTIVVAPGANACVSVPSRLRGPVLCQLEVPMHVVVAAARATEGFFAVNAAPAATLPQSLVERCDLIVVNESEYAAQPEVAAARLVVVTLGSAGAAAYSHGHQVARASARHAAVASTVEAGDAFCAAVVLALARGWPIEAALDLACSVGAAAVESSDAQPLFDPLETYASREEAGGSAQWGPRASPARARSRDPGQQAGRRP